VFAAAVVLAAQQKPVDEDSFDTVSSRGRIRTLKRSRAFHRNDDLFAPHAPAVASGVVAVERPSRCSTTNSRNCAMLIDGDRLTVSWRAAISRVTNIASRTVACRKAHRQQAGATAEHFDIVSGKAAIVLARYC
jgi:hypothetical protein